MNEKPERKERIRVRANCYKRQFVIGKEKKKDIKEEVLM